MSMLGGFKIAGEGVAGAFLTSPPTCTVTAPVGTVVSAPVTVTWTYSSPVGRVQSTYRVRVLSQDGATTLYDSATLSGADVTFDIPFTLSAGSAYIVRVTVGDGFDTGSDDSDFTFDDGSTATIAENSQVGSVYEVAINGVGYMLFDHPDRQTRYERRVVPLDSPRLSTSETPFSQAIDRYTLASSIDWSDGAGQDIANRDTSSAAAYRKSDGINPFDEKGTIRLLPAALLKDSTTFSAARCVVAGGKLYVLVGNGQFNVYDDPADASATNFSITGAGAFESVCSDGTNWYYADGANVYRNSTAADAAAWSTSNAHLVQWCTDRIFIARPSSGSTPNALYEMADAGTEVGGARIWTLAVGTTITSITSGDGYVWFTGNRNDRSAVFACQLGSDNSYLTALEMPAGLTATAVGYYQGNVFIRALDPTGRGIIFRCLTADGKLTPTRVVELPGTVDQTLGDFAGDDRYVYFSWRGMGQDTLTASKTGSGVGCIDLSTGGWSKWIGHRQATSEGSGAVPSIVMWYGRPTFVIEGYGCLVADAEDGGDEGIVGTGALETSLIDLGTSLRKVWTELQATFDPLPAGGGIAVSYSIDGGVSYDPLTAVTTAGSKSARWTLNQESDTISFKVTLTGTTQSPRLRSLTVRANPVGLADQVIVMPVNCHDHVTGLNKHPLVDQDSEGSGARRVRTLESLVQTRVQIQDIDWPITQTSQTFDLISAEYVPTGVFDRSAGRRGDGGYTILTLRRSFK